MDTNDLTLALREATDDVEPRPNFASDVLRGGRRRRTRNRFTIGAAVAGTAAVAVVAATVLPNHLASPPPPADRPTEFSLLDRSGGELIDDEAVTRAAALGWQNGLAGITGEAAGISPENLHGEPHVYWAGYTPIGAAAIVAQEATLADGTRTVVSGAVADNPDDDRPEELELTSVTPTPAAFLLPDNKTLLAPLPDGIRDLYVSTAITVNEEGRSVRSVWHSYSDDDTATFISLAETGLQVTDTTVSPPTEPGSPHNLRIAIGTTEGRDGYLPVSFLPNTPAIQDRGLLWPAEARHVPEARDLPRSAWEVFRDGLRSSGLLDPDAYAPGEPQWTVTADLPDGRTLILSEYQELDHPAWVFSVLMRPDGSVESVSRVNQIDQATVSIIYPAPDDQGTVVAAVGMPISYRTSATDPWTPLGTDAALVPADAVEITVGDALATVN